ncbi:putative Cysteine-rich secretory protein 2 [Hypsibius exemplaris]|uniref:Cysteine-rich secretory protein 2 n=1 Tax=Hypsibius exemplaris TaxID=2072580 RepID=A0A9X6RLL4_HYPEX|nr:putative Cysteine-rich secretory protein 2 [Hypsibius exemplaris]
MIASGGLLAFLLHATGLVVAAEEDAPEAGQLKERGYGSRNGYGGGQYSGGAYGGNGGGGIFSTYNWLGNDLGLFANELGFGGFLSNMGGNSGYNSNSNSGYSPNSNQYSPNSKHLQAQYSPPHPTITTTTTCTFRRGVKAADMLQVSWDPTAAADAQRLAAECRPAGPNAHDDPADRHSCGQNIASDVQNWEGVFQLWNQEVKDFKWGVKCNLRATGNYTQNVWASSNKIGCGWSACGGKGNFVCNYCPTGNIVNGCKPYIQGPPVCGSCGGEGSATCPNGLCTAPIPPGPSTTTSSPSTTTSSPGPTPNCANPRDTTCASTQTKILSLINEVRRNVKAADMLQVSWDATAAADAQQFASKCLSAHNTSDDRHGCGQNIASGTGNFNWDVAFQLWNQEVKDFTWGVKCDLAATGHYTQNVWASSNKIGCGWSDCGGNNNMVCNYCPAGNIGNGCKPFVQGAPVCGSCGGEGSALCPNGLCTALTPTG